ncbi:hypothetical protein [Aquisalibacillus elongatus]|uniref:Uncharacterized protein n=1 Tax=Aquisalibacillus elongatus TaxID=485577 RepID=A0A3N5C3E0_9BACI|nr:hypothetical protein [Aquisalibacillus elongatus]RPF53952.1 hypothetical protein EDC24_1138 [Aquisalibacillus elongatus]
MSYQEYWEKLYDIYSDLTQVRNHYWAEYSSFGDWQFWVVMALLVLPLIVLVFTVDRRRIFEVFFFGYTVHVLWTYISDILEYDLLFVHTYFVSPFFPSAINMTASLLAVGFLLLYQYCTNNGKNFYIWTLGLSALFAFGAASIEEMVGFANIGRGFNQFYIFLIDVSVAYVAYWGTRFLVYVKNKAK